MNPKIRELLNERNKGWITYGELLEGVWSYLHSNPGEADSVVSSLSNPDDPSLRDDPDVAELAADIIRLRAARPKEPPAGTEDVR